MREIFFARDKFTLFGEGDFTGTFHMFKGGRELKGDFTSALAGVNDYRFPESRRLAGLGARSHGSDARHRGLSRRQGGVQVPDGAARQDAIEPARAVFDVNYRDVDLNALTEFYQMRGLRLAGRASGHNEMSWPLGTLRRARRIGHARRSRRSGGLQGPQLAAGRGGGRARSRT